MTNMSRLLRGQRSIWRRLLFMSALTPGALLGGRDLSCELLQCAAAEPLPAQPHPAPPPPAQPQQQPQPRPRTGAAASNLPPLRAADGEPIKPEAQFERAKLAYQRGDYSAVVVMLRPLLYPQVQLAQEEQVLLSHKLLALSYYFERDEAGAEQEFNLLLSLRPDFALDPVVDPLKAVAFLDDIRRRNAQRLAEIRRQQAEEEQRQKAEAAQLQKQAEALAQLKTHRIYIEKVVHKKITPIDFLPFGVPQLMKRRRTVGALLCASEILLGSASLSTWLVVRYRYPNGMFPPREYNTAVGLTATYLTTGVLFWGTVLGGLIDALVHARSVVELRELEIPPSAPGTSPPRPPVARPAAPAKPSLSLHLGLPPMAPLAFDGFNTAPALLLSSPVSAESSSALGVAVIGSF